MEQKLADEMMGGKLPTCEKHKHEISVNATQRKFEILSYSLQMRCSAQTCALNMLFLKCEEFLQKEWKNSMWRGENVWEWKIFIITKSHNLLRQAATRKTWKSSSRTKTKKNFRSLAGIPSGWEADSSWLFFSENFHTCDSHTSFSIFQTLTFIHPRHRTQLLCTRKTWLFILITKPTRSHPAIPVMMMR